MKEENKNMESLLIDYIEGNLAQKEQNFVIQKLQENALWQEEYKQLKEVMDLFGATATLSPDASLATDFQKMLSEEIAISKQPTVIKRTLPKQWNFISPMQIAASISLLLVGLIVGIWITNNQNHEREIAMLQKEMAATKQLIVVSLQNQSSASQRLKGVNASYSFPQIDNEIIDVLINTMNNDENSNVKLAAIEALSKMSGNKKVRKSLIEALKTEKDPIVQISLINLMIMMNEKGAIENLKHIIHNNETIDMVKDEAHFGIIKLS
jgi:hypothetical protein